MKKNKPYSVIASDWYLVSAQFVQEDCLYISDASDETWKNSEFRNNTGITLFHNHIDIFFIILLIVSFRFASQLLNVYSRQFLLKQHNHFS